MHSLYFGQPIECIEILRPLSIEAFNVYNDASLVLPPPTTSFLQEFTIYILL
jgi:hypothetical protein